MVSMKKVLTGLAWSLVSGSIALACESIKDNSDGVVSGTLHYVELSGYSGYIALELDNPICIIADEKDQFSQSSAGVTELQVTSSEFSIDKRLIGYKVRIEGQFFQGNTGYYFTQQAFNASSIVPLDEKGRRAIKKKPEMPLKPLDINAYYADVKADKHLIVKTYKMDGMPLLPAELYMSHIMTGSETVYFSLPRPLHYQSSEAQRYKRYYIML